MFFWKKRRKQAARAEPSKRNVVFADQSGWEEIIKCDGYTPLSEVPEIVAAVDEIASIVASMTIHLMENTETGDMRVKNELSRMVDITPNKYMTRYAFVQWIVRTMLLEGDGNAVVIPETRRGYLRNLQPVPASKVSFMADGDSYKILISGKEYAPEKLMHFVLRPDPENPWKGAGLRVSLRDVANNLQQAAATKKGFMSSKWKPSIIVKVDALTEEFASAEGRQKLLKEYVQSAEAGDPWLLPAEQFSVEQVRPLSLADLALAENVEIDKRTVASVIGVPPFVVGVGDFDRAEWNNFVNVKIRGIAMAIEQVMSRDLLYGDDYYFRMNPRSLYSYDLKDISSVSVEQRAAGVITGNEARDWLGFSPKKGLDELVMLENYIPADRLGDQKKLNGGDDDGNE